MQAEFPGSSQMVFMTNLAYDAWEIFQAQSPFLSQVEKNTDLFFPLYRWRREVAACIGDGCLSAVTWGVESQIRIQFSVLHSLVIAFEWVINRAET